MRRRALAALSLLVFPAAASCVADSDSPIAPSFDAGELDVSFPVEDGSNPGDGSRPAQDASNDDATTTDSSTPDGTPEASANDAGSDAAIDQSTADAGADAETDASVDADNDTGVDAGIDATVDAAAEAAVDAGIDTGVDAGPVSCVVKIFGDYYTRTDGSVVYMVGSQSVVMNSTTGQPLKTVVAVAPQSDHACALLADQTVWCWPTQNNGGNANGDLGNGTIGGSTTAFSATPVVTQAADAGAATLTNVIAIQEGSNSFYTHPTCAIKSDHSLWCWGNSGANGGPPTGMFWGTTGSVASVPYAFPLASGPAPGDGGAAPLILADKVSVGVDALCYLNGGSVYCLGADISGNLGDNSSDSHSTGNFHAYPVSVVASNGFPGRIDALVSGYRFACALGSTGVWCWGTDGAKQMGNPGAPTQFCNLNYCQPEPVPVQATFADGGVSSGPDAGMNPSPLANIAALTAGYMFGCAVDTAGSLRCWGAFNAGVSSLSEATLYNSGTAPSSNVVQVTASPEQEDINTGVRYLTQSGVLVSRQTVINPICP